MTETVVIAGAGPTGLMLSCELGLAGVPAVVADPRSEPSPASYGVAINPACSEILDQRGLLDPIRASCFPMPAAHYSLLWLDLAKRDEKHADGYAVPQTRIEQLLEERAVSLGVEIRHRTRVNGFEQDDDGVTVELASEAGPERLRCAYLAGCDGGDSTVRSLLGIGFPGTQDPRCRALIGELEVGMSELAPGHFGAYVPGGGGTIYIGAPIAPDVLRVMTMQYGQDAPGLDVPVTEDELYGAIEQTSGTALKDANVKWVSRFSDATRQADRYRQGRVFLAGDAAHVFFAFNGHGLSTSIQDAVNLGWKLAADLQGWAPPDLLDTYEAERHPAARQVCRDVRAQEELLRGPQLGPLRETFTELLRIDEVQRYLLGLVTGVGVRYPFSARDGVAAHPLFGRRLPQVTLATANGERTTAAILRCGRGVLLDLCDSASDRALAAAWTGRVEAVTAEPAAELDAAVLLLRPDGHVAWARGAQEDPDGLRAALIAWFGEPTASGGAA